MLSTTDNPIYQHSVSGRGPDPPSPPLQGTDENNGESQSEFSYSSSDDDSSDDELGDNESQSPSATVETIEEQSNSIGKDVIQPTLSEKLPQGKMGESAKMKSNKKTSKSPPQPRWKKTWNNFYYRPLFVFFRAFLIAWIYVLLPCDNYWIYYLVKNQYWCFLTLTTYVELFSALLPDVPESIYIASYVFGFFVAPLTRTLEYFYGMAEYAILNTVTVLFSFVVIIILFGVDTLRYPYTKDQLRLREKMERKQSLTLPSGEPLPSSSVDHSGQSSIYRSMFHAIGRSRIPSVTEDDDGLVRAGLPAPPSTISPSFVFTPSILSKQTNSDIELHNQGTYPLPQISVDRFDERTRIMAAAKANASRGPVVFRTAHNNLKMVDPTLVFICDVIVAMLDRIFVAEYFFFLPRFWNHRYWVRHSKLHPLLNRRWLILRTGIFIIIYSSDYLFLIYFTEYFREHAKTNYKRVGLFLVYITVNTVYRTIVKTLGMILDKYKGRSVSMFFLGEVMGLFFYYCFYRVLFESIRSVPEFIAFQLLHLTSEWVLYVLRCTSWYYQISEAVVLKYTPSWFLNRTRMSHKNWQQFIALDFGIRCAVFVTTGYGILIMLITIQYVSWVGNVNGLLEDKSNFTYTSLFIIAAVSLELINAWGMNRFFFHRQGLDVQSEARHCFALPHFSLLALLVACNLFTNPIFAFITVDYQTR